MRIESSNSVSARNGISSDNIKQDTAPTQKINSIDVDKTNKQNVNKEWSQTLTKNMSQLNEYEKDNMHISERVVIDAIEKANKAISGGNRRFEFSIHEKTNEIMVKVFNSETDELIREIPNEKILDMVAKLCEMAGILVDERR